MQSKTAQEIREATSQSPILQGRSKRLYKLNENEVLVELIPTLDSFTANRHHQIPGTEVLRLDMYELAVEKLRAASISTAFERRIDDKRYIATYCSNPPFEVIVKCRAIGSTLRKYPGLFSSGHKFASPIVKFDFRTDPEDYPISEDYVREYGENPKVMREIALTTCSVLGPWLSPYELLDFCIVIGRDRRGEYMITSEVSPDCMRIRSVDGESFDKDLFRSNHTDEEILVRWKLLVQDLRQKVQR